MKWSVNGAQSDFPDGATRDFIINEIAYAEGVLPVHIIIRTWTPPSITYVNVLERLASAYSPTTPVLEATNAARKVVSELSNESQLKEFRRPPYFAMLFQFAIGDWKSTATGGRATPRQNAVRSAAFPTSKFSPEEYLAFLQKMRSDLAALRSLVETERAHSRKLASVDINLTTYEPDEVGIVLRTRTSKTVFELLDRFEPSDTFPFAFAQGWSGSELKSFYKIQKTTQFTSGWIGDLVPNNRAIQLRMLDMKVHTRTYVPIVWDIDRGFVEMTLASTGGTTSTAIQDVVNTFIKSFGLTADEIGTGTGVEAFELTYTRGRFSVPGVYVDMAVFLDLVETDPIFSGYFFVNETIDPSMTKDHFFIYYQPAQSAGTGTGATGVPADESHARIKLSFNIREANEGDWGMKKNDKYVEVRVSDAPSETEVEAMRENFKRLLGIYTIREKSILAYYQSIIPDFGEETKQFKERGRVRSSGDSKNVALRKYAPDIFIANYSRKVCQPRDRQPAIIPPSLTGEELDKRIQETSAQNFHGHWLYCPNPTFKFLYFRPNPLPNARQFPKLPCCNMAPGADRKASKANTTHVAVLDKSMKPGHRGRLPIDVEELVESYEIVKHLSWYRVGMPEKNSFLHAVAFAMDDSYNRLKIDSASNVRIVETLKSDLRDRLAGGLPVVLQNFFDYPPEAGSSEAWASELLMNNDSSALRFTPLLELHYGCNIIMFTKNEDFSGTDAPYYLAVPYGGMTWSAPPADPNRPTILLMLYTTDKIPRVEVVFAKAGTTVQTSFGPNDNLTELLQLRDYAFTNYVASSDEATLANSNGVRPRDVVVPSDVDGAKVEAQVLDSFGKRRGQLVSFSLPSGNESRVFFFSPPTYALDVPVVSLSDALDVSTPLPIIDAMFTLPLAVSEIVQNEDGKLIGAVTQYGYCTAVFRNEELGVPMVGLPDYVYHPIDGTRPKRDRYRDQKKIASFLLQTVLFGWSNVARYVDDPAGFYPRLLTVDSSRNDYKIKEFSKGIAPPHDVPALGDLVLYEGTQYLITRIGMAHITLASDRKDEIRIRTNVAGVRVIHSLAITCTSEKLRTNLLNQLDLYLLSFPTLVQNYFHSTSFVDYYQSPIDFRSSPYFEVFGNREEIQIFFHSRDIHQLYEFPVPERDAVLPPYYALVSDLKHETSKIELVK